MAGDTPAVTALRAMLQGGDTPDTQALAEQLVRVEQNVAYRFANPALLRVALRHSSLGGAVNTQLAWLGQNLVSFLAASEAYSINPAGDRKTMHAHREAVTNKEGMAAAAERLNLPPFLQLHAGQTQGLSAGMKGDLFTAVLGAIFIDSGGSDIEAVRVVFRRSQQPAGAVNYAAAAASVPAPPVAMLAEPPPAAVPAAAAQQHAVVQQAAAVQQPGRSAVEALRSQWEAGGAAQSAPVAAPVQEQLGDDVDILGI